jgi:glycosyltransferase involved in cell wall biosynthesis
MAEEFDLSVSEGIETYHVSHLKVPVRGGSYPLYLWSAVAAYRRLRNCGFRPDVIHAHVYGAGVPAGLIAGRSRIPLVLTEHFSGVALRSLGRVEEWKARYAYNRAAQILPVSRFLRDAMQSYGIDRPFEIVPNVVDASLFFAPHRTPNATRRLLFVGNLERLHLKGFPTLLRALVVLRERRNDWRLDVIGDGDERVHYETSAVELRLSKYVTFHGYRPKPDVARSMRDADLLVLPSRVETFGSVVAEALVSGLPVVSTNVGGVPEIVDDRSGRLVPPDDPVALADMIDQTLDELDAFDRGAIAAAARDLYRPEVVGAQLSEIYESVLTESRALNRLEARAEQPD